MWPARLKWFINATNGCHIIMYISLYPSLYWFLKIMFLCLTGLTGIWRFLKFRYLCIFLLMRLHIVHRDPLLHHPFHRSRRPQLCAKRCQDWRSGTSLVVQWLRLSLPMQGRWARFLVGKLRSHMPHGQKIKTWNRAVL